MSEWVRCWGGELRDIRAVQLVGPSAHEFPRGDLDVIRDWYDAGNSMGGEAGTVVGPNPTHVTEVGE
jgi:hypothetical protein